MKLESAKSESSEPEKVTVKEKANLPEPPPQPKKTPFLLRTVPLWGIVMATGFWAFNGKIPVEVAGKTILVTPRSNIPVQSRSSGQIVQINIRPGDTVKVGQVLAILDLPELKDKLLSQQQKLRELQTQKRDLTKVQDQTNVLQRQNLLSQKQTIPQQIKAINQQRQANQQEISSTQEQIIVKQKEIKAYSQRITQLKERTQLLEPRLEAGKALVAEGAIAPLSMDLIQAQRQVQDNDIQITQMQIQSNDASAKIGQLRAGLVGNQAKDKDLTNQIRSLNSQLTGLGAQLEEIDYQTLQTNTDRDNQIADLQREIKNLQISINSDSKVLSPRSGKILEVSTNRGQVIQSGTRLATIEETPKNQQTLGFTFFAIGDVEKIRTKMPIEIVPGVENRERYGGIVAEVVSIAAIPSTAQEVTSILGSEELAKQITSGGTPVIKVFSKLKRDPNTKSGFQWTRGSGVPYELPENTVGNAYLVVEERSLVSHVTPMLRKLTGIYADAK